ncbi:signal peptidase I [Streptomyces sp. NPDC058232]|uniref:signal peptidase I n=1 Tax=Streptomyces TaxID=1883 RepID=UPI0028C5089A|nr:MULTISPECIES: signal peptidase I [unclassified Streptomyces]WTE54297.1 signal peptidase I [Streptomyces sp. NBC_01620]WTE62439.1 signal peptidase I [Streptomyces sp. NBC_01617]WTI89819.1 signal peptidase I [Streptomyces sp. NBC_00724]WNO67395.1 signal peptidase I [Streptomyces sp. AM2-3-1]WSC71944.1 signal peptidase I [Streptomyces sp. NBC_01760]
MSGTGRTGDGHGRLGSMLSGLAVAVGLVLFLGGFAWGALVYKPYIVPTESMTPTVNAGDRVLAERVDGSEVRRGDVVVFTDPAWDNNMPMVKRVVGIGGDKIACCEKSGRLTVNGKPIDEPYLQTEGLASVKNFTANVPKGQLFLLGDERSGSLDSRVHLDDPGQGSVPRSDVQARVDAIAWPMDGMIGRPQAFAALPGGVSAPGPLKLQLGAVVVGVVLIFGGTAYGPIAARSARRRNGQDRRVPAGAH